MLKVRWDMLYGFLLKNLAVFSVMTLPLSSDRQHPSYDACLEVRGEIIRTVCTVVHSYKHT